MAALYCPQIDVKLAPNFEKYDKANANGELHVYNTTSKNRGVVKIINIYKTNHDDPEEDWRKGSEIDVRNLVSLFEQMGFTIDMDEKTKTQSPYTKQDIIDNLTAFVNNKKLKTADSAILFIMGHGSRNLHKRDFLRLANNEKIYYDEVYEYFNNSKCKYMQNKPKLIFFQMCRGDVSDLGVSTIQTDSIRRKVNPIRKDLIPSFTDLLIINSTVPGFKALRCTMKGSIFIQILCTQFMTAAHEDDVHTILLTVNQKMSEQTYNMGPNLIMQSAEHTNRTFGKCYLNPGIYRDNNGVVRYIKTDQPVHQDNVAHEENAANISARNTKQPQPGANEAVRPQVNVDYEANETNVSDENSGEMLTNVGASEPVVSRKELPSETKERGGAGDPSPAGWEKSNSGEGSDNERDGECLNDDKKESDKKEQKDDSEGHYLIVDLYYEY